MTLGDSTARTLRYLTIFLTFLLNVACVIKLKLYNRLWTQLEEHASFRKRLPNLLTLFSILALVFLDIQNIVTALVCEQIDNVTVHHWLDMIVSILFAIALWTLFVRNWTLFFQASYLKAVRNYGWKSVLDPSHHQSIWMNLKHTVGNRKFVIRLGAAMIFIDVLTFVIEFALGLGWLIYEYVIVVQLIFIAIAFILIIIKSSLAKPVMDEYLSLDGELIYVCSFGLVAIVCRFALIDGLSMKHHSLDFVIWCLASLVFVGMNILIPLWVVVNHIEEDEMDPANLEASGLSSAASSSKRNQMAIGSDLGETIRSYQGYCTFMFLLANECAAESLLFCTEVMQWRNACIDDLIALKFTPKDIPKACYDRWKAKLPEHVPQSMICKTGNNRCLQAYKLYCKYVDDDAHYAVNISDKVRTKLREAFQPYINSIVDVESTPNQSPTDPNPDAEQTARHLGLTQLSLTEFSPTPDADCTTDFPRVYSVRSIGAQSSGRNSPITQPTRTSTARSTSTAVLAAGVLRSVEQAHTQSTEIIVLDDLPVSTSPRHENTHKVGFVSVDQSSRAATPNLTDNESGKAVSKSGSSRIDRVASNSSVGAGRTITITTIERSTQRQKNFEMRTKIVEQLHCDIQLFDRAFDQVWRVLRHLFSVYKSKGYLNKEALQTLEIISPRSYADQPYFEKHFSVSPPSSAPPVADIR